MQNDDGTMRSSPTPTGQTVNDEQEAIEWMKKGEYLGHRKYSVRFEE